MPKRKPEVTLRTAGGIMDKYTFDITAPVLVVIEGFLLLLALSLLPQAHSAKTIISASIIAIIRFIFFSSKTCR